MLIAVAAAAIAFAAGVGCGLLLGHELSLWSVARKRGGEIDLTSQSRRA